MDHLQAWFGGKPLAEMFDEVGVDFYRHNAGCTLQQFFGERATPWANFNNEILRKWTSCGCNALKNRTLDEEMLAEFGARDQLLTLRRRWV